MKNINEINPSEYGFYHLSKIDGDVEVFAKTSAGLTPLDGVDYYQTDNGVLIAFAGEFNTGGFHDYKVVGQNDSYTMQTVPYEDMQHELNKTTDCSFSFFNFWKSAEIPSQTAGAEAWGGTKSIRNGKEFVRCDYNKFGPVSFYPRTTAYNLVRIKLVLSASGIGHIMRADTSDLDFKDKSTQIVNTYAKTFSGILKQVSEWADVSNPPFNSQEDIAITAKAFIQELGLEPVLADINPSEDNMRVSRYLLGNTDVYEDIEERDLMPDSLTQYILDHCRYKTISSLLKNSNRVFSIDQKILNKEKTLLESDLFAFCIANSIDLNNGLEYIENIIKTSESLTHPVKNILEKINKYRYI